ncbi:protein ORGAN SIZE RELATED 1-like [Salvia splendens]|uniref:protein ORGAN SIZE RELATED 1-like n=1 Tax=Salvia splendens TaxID=180675 RepID=UPI001C2811AF|nr:protein ORGAN SIZE RELATED 1-like [Salvia splendens]
MVYSRIEERLSFELNRSAGGDLNPRRKPPSLMYRYFSLRMVALMLLLTVSLLLLPLLLPPLPPPPLTLLLIPVAIMAVLVFLAFAPPQLPNVAL